MRKIFRIVAWIAAGVFAVLALGLAALQAAPVRGWLAGAISEAASTPGATVTIEGLDGWLPASPRVARVVVADEAGAWLVLEDIRIDWSPMALVWGDIVLDNVAVAEVRWQRKPVAPPVQTAPGGFKWPSLKIDLPSVRVDALSAPRVRIGEAIAGKPAILALGGRLDMLSLQHRAVLGLSVKQAGQGAARAAIDIDWNRDDGTFRLMAEVADRAGGLLARLAGLRDDVPLALRLGSSGRIDAWQATLQADAGSRLRARGEASIRREAEWHRLRLRLGLDMAGLIPAEGGGALDGRWVLDLDAARNDSGALRVSRVDLESPKAHLDGRLVGEAPAAPLQVKGVIEALTPGPVSIDVTATPDRPWGEADPVIAINASGGIAGARATFRGKAQAGNLAGDLAVDLPNLKAFGLEQGKLSLAGRLDASLDATSLELDTRGRFSDARFGDADLDRLLGSSGDIDAVLRIGKDGALEDIRLGVKGAALAMQARIEGTLKAQRFAIEGQLTGQPLRVEASLAPGRDLRTDIRIARLSLGTVSLAGDLSLGVRGLLAGTLRLEAGDLAALSRLVDADLKGGARGALEFRAEGRQQQTRLDIVAPDLRIDTVRLAQARIEGRLIDPFGKLALDLKLQAERVDADGFVVTAMAAEGKGRLAALEVTARAMRGDTELTTRGRLKANRSPIVISLSALRLAQGQREVSLATPATVTITSGVTNIAPARLAAGSGTLRLGGRIGPDSTLALEPASLPLWAVGLLAEPLPVDGEITGRVAFRGPIAERRATFSLVARGLSAEGQREALRNAVLRAEGTTGRDAVTFAASLDGSRGASLRFTGRVPFVPAGAMAIETKGNVDLALANSWLGATGERAAGRLDLEATITGPLTAPRVSGEGRVRDGFFRSAEAGLELRDIEARFQGSERRLVMSALSARTPNNGSIAARGDLSLDPATGYPLNLALTASDAQIVATGLTTVVADLDLRLAGTLQTEARLGGTVAIRRWDIRVPERLNRALTPIPVRHVNTPPGWSAGQDDGPDDGPASALRFALDLAVRAPERVFVRGQGIDAEFGGEARVAGTLDDPSVRGRFDLRRGAFAILSQRIVLSRGNVQFLGDPVPLLDIAGGVTKNGISATVTATGRADDPKIALASVPALPQEEILARLLFSKQATQLSPFEAAQLVQAVGKWSGLDTGPDILERLRTALGIDALSATTDDKGNTLLSAGRYVGAGVYVGVSQAAGGSATVEVDLTDEIKLRGEAGATDSKVGVAAEWEY